MTEYKKGDKVVAELDGMDVDNLNENGDFIANKDQFLGKLEDFQPKQEKIKMTFEEKKEFDELKEKYVTPYAVISNMFAFNVPNLFRRVNTHKSDEKRAQNQFEFIRALEHPELIEVIKPKHEFKVGDLVEDLVEVDRGKGIIISINANESDFIPILVLFEDTTYKWVAIEDLTFIKNDVIDWGD
ncbi:hypothetical protein [Liquorilactobacillus mali]|uniref:hypothetical protein n=1 Tax=Liquorilactobacillus mali TaxID=1618 RepID=UPI00234FCCAB|nr:hypothetical protein [Liquorilactobacillus mali]MDC7953207.1 hypothetical protein [Liquorilactobacillus mali]